MRLRLIYSPEGGEAQEFEFDPDAALSLEAEALEDAGGESWNSYAQWIEKIGSGNIRARRALLWVMLRRTNPSVRFVDVVFKLDEFDIEWDDESEPAGKGELGDTNTGSPSPQQDSELSPNNSPGL